MKLLRKLCTPLALVRLLTRRLFNFNVIYCGTRNPDGYVYVVVKGTPRYNQRYAISTAGVVQNKTLTAIKIKQIERKNKGMAKKKKKKEEEKFHVEYSSNRTPKSVRSNVCAHGAGNLRTFGDAFRRFVVVGSFYFHLVLNRSDHLHRLTRAPSNQTLRTQAVQTHSSPATTVLRGTMCA